MGDAFPLEPAPPARGTFLIAAPTLLDPNFMHTVILLCAHGPEGSHGVVVNRPGDMTIEDLESDHMLLEGRRDRLWIGGPVQTEALQVLHRYGPGVPGAMPVMEDVHFGGDPAVLRSLMDKQMEPEDHIRFVLGYSGWGEGQLESELEEGSWVVCKADPGLTFDPSPKTVWQRTLRAMGGPFAALAEEPPNPSWN